MGMLALLRVHVTDDIILEVGYLVVYQTAKATVMTWYQSLKRRRKRLNQC